MKKTIINLLATVLTGTALSLSAQVQYKIDWKEDLAAYQVSLVSQATWEGNQRITSSAQVSVRAAAGSLEIFNVKSLLGGVNWDFNSRYNTPAEAPAFDYFSFGLTTMGTAAIPYAAGQEVPLFTFQNANECGGAVFLVDNANDPFMPPNASKANIGNQLTVFGAGGSAYVGNHGTGKADCGLVSSTKPVVATRFELAPTLASEFVQVSFDWQEAPQNAEFRLYDQSGRLVQAEKKDIVQGPNQIKLDLNKIKPGSYSVEIRAKDFVKSVGRFLKA